MDMEKVIKAIEDCVYHKTDCVGCDYDGCIFKYGDCRRDLLADALTMLKEQGEEIEKLQDRLQHAVEVGEVLLEEREAVKPVRDEQTGRIWLCGKCGSYVGFEDNDPDDQNEFDKYCHECGRPVLWEGR